MRFSRLRVRRALLSVSLAIIIGMISTARSDASGGIAPTARSADTLAAAGPVAAIADPGDITIGAAGRFDAGGSQGSGLTYSWDFGDGGPMVGGATVQHSFNAVNDYVVRLTVTDSQGATDTTTRKVRVIPSVSTLTATPILGQIVPASSFTAMLSLNAAGPAQVSAKIGGAFLSSDRWDFNGGSTPALFELPDIRVANEDNADIVDQLLSKPGSSIPLANNVKITLSYPVAAGASESVDYTMSLRKDATAAPAGAAPAQGDSGIWSITYPSYLGIVGVPVPSDDVDYYYLKGDPQFHSVDSLAVRQFAIRTARAGGIFPNDPQRAADNIYRYINGLLGIGDPGDLLKDVALISRVKDGVLVPGARKGEYICITHAYFLSSLTRTLGLPTREETIGFGRGVSQDETGAWTLNFYQEGANEVWYDHAWHHYDTWIGTRDRDDYLQQNLTEIAWYAFSAQSTPFIDTNGAPTGLAGHDFSLGKYVGSPGSPEQWRFLEQHTRPNVKIADPGPGAYASADRAAPAPFETVSPGIANPPATADGAGGN